MHYLSSTVDEHFSCFCNGDENEKLWMLMGMQQMKLEQGGDPMTLMVSHSARVMEVVPLLVAPFVLKKKITHRLA